MRAGLKMMFSWLCTLCARSLLPWPGSVARHVLCSIIFVIYARGLEIVSFVFLCYWSRFGWQWRSCKQWEVLLFQLSFFFCKEQWAVKTNLQAVGIWWGTQLMLRMLAGLPVVCPRDDIDAEKDGVKQLISFQVGCKGAESEAIGQFGSSAVLFSGG